MHTRFAHHRLDAYCVALELFAGVEAFAATLPRGQAELKDQARRAAAATVRHLAEGANRRLPREKAARFVLARAECGECAASLEMAATLDLRPCPDLLRQADRVAAMCTGLIRREERRAGAAEPPGSAERPCAFAQACAFSLRVPLPGPGSPSAPSFPLRASALRVLRASAAIPPRQAPPRRPATPLAYPEGALWRWRRILAGFLLAAAVPACDSGSSTLLTQVPACAGAVPLTAAEVETIIAQAAGRAAYDGQAYTITVVNREGIVVGSLRMAGAVPGLEFETRAKARTAAFLSSNQHAFNTRTAFFIIQDHFPPGLPNVPGGPLYGVQFSSLACADVVGEELMGGAKLFDQEGNGLSGDTGSMPLYRDGCLIGAVAVDGGPEPDDALEERAAWTASLGFRPAVSIYGSNIHVDGIRFEFMEERPSDAEVTVPAYADLLLAGGVELVTPVAAPPDQVFATGMFGGLTCEIRYPVVDSVRPVPATERLLAADVTAMMDAAAALSERTRAGIRRPLGTAMRCFISVVDLDGTILGSIRTPDATLFSFDVSIQKARTAAYFSTDTVAFTCRALGFLSQAFFPPGIDAAPEGPLHGLQDALSAPLFAPVGGACQPPTVAELANGITIFPGGVALYKGGVLVGAIGVSGDGVGQDDVIASEGGALFPPPPGVRCDEVSEADALAALGATLADIRTAALAVATDPGSLPAEVAQATAIADATVDADTRLAANGLQGIRLPYVKFPREPLR